MLTAQGISFFAIFVILPIVIYLIVLTFRLFKKALKKEVLLELPFEAGGGEFVVERAGRYSLWHKGLRLTLTPLGKYHPEIVNIETGKQVNLSGSLIRPTVSGMDKYATVELCNFRVSAGRYKLQIVEGGSPFLMDRLTFVLTSSIARTFPLNTKDYSLVIRTPFSKLLFMSCVLMIFVCIALLILSFGLCFGSEYIVERLVK